MRTTVIIFLICLCSPVPSQRSVESLLFDLRFNEAEELLNHAEAETGPATDSPYLRNYLLFLKTLIDGDEASYKKYLNLSARYTRQMKELESDDPHWLNMMSLMFLQSSIINMDRDDRWKSIRNYYTAWRITDYNREQHPGYVPGLKTRAVLELIAGSVPAESSWVLRWAGIEGSLESGQAKLREYYRKCQSEQRLEAVLILTLSYLQYDPDRNAAYEFIGTSRTDAEATFLYEYFRALAAMKARHNDEAIDILSSLAENAKTRGFPYVYLLLGEAKLNRLDMDAGFFLRLFLDNHTGKHYIKMACYKLSWYYFLNEDQKLYRQMRTRALTSGQELVEADRQAAMEAKEISALNPGLLAARLYHDGGYYERGIALLLDHPLSLFASERDRIERDYRLARLYHGYGDLKEAVAYYHMVLLSEGGMRRLFVPNSMLQLGIIAEENGQYQQAAGWYNSCLATEKEYYKRGINLQAESGLQRISPHLEENHSLFK